GSSRPPPIFCAAGGGCDIVRQSAFAHLLGIPTPAFGVAFFAVALVLGLLPRRRALVYFGAAGATAAVAFIAIQGIVIHAWCKFCLATDASAIVLCVLAVLDQDDVDPVTTSARASMAARAAVALAAPFGVHAAMPKPALPAQPLAEAPAPAFPDVVAREQRPGVVTVVEFVDFQCPYCRRLHAALGEAIKQFAGN